MKLIAVCAHAGKSVGWPYDRPDGATQTTCL
jgi:hypothetical protein